MYIVRHHSLPSMNSFNTTDAAIFIIQAMLPKYIYPFFSDYWTTLNHIWFKLIYLRSIAKQVILTYINHYRPLIPDDIHLFFWTRLERREARPVLICWAPSKEASGTIFITSLVWRGRGSNPRPSAHGANALTTEPPLRCIWGILKH